MIRARVADKMNEDGSNRHSQDADEQGVDFLCLPRDREEAHNTLRGGSSPANGSSMEKTTEEESRPWPDLIPDLVFDMLQRLSVVDRLSATNAIASWHQAAEKPLGPCLLSFANDNKTCTISGMLHDFKETVTTHPDMPAYIQILSSKHGWLLLMGEVDENTCSIFFYNPTSRSVMKLPRPSNGNLQWCHFSFSAPPDSPNCVVIASLFSDDMKRLAICEKGRSEWTLVQEDENLKSFEMQYMSPVFHKGRFYWIGTDGRVSEFDLVTRSWAVHGKDMCLCPSTFRFYLVESDDELFFVWSTREGDTIRIYKLDLDNDPNIWKEVYNLGGRCFFVGFNACVSLTTRVLSCKEEKIYFQMVDEAQNNVYYSVQTREMHPRGDFMGCSELNFNYCWIEPQWLEPKYQELNW